MQQRIHAREQWRPIPGYEGFYEASDHGRVRSVDRTIVSRTGITYELRGRLLAQTPSGRDGRFTVKLSRAGDTATKLVHQLVLMAFVGPRPPGLSGCHGNGNPTDNRLANLRWDTHSSNMRDKIAHGTDPMRNRVVCPRRHRLVAPNLVAYRQRLGHRVCLACARARANEQHANKYGHPFDFAARADEHYRKIMGRSALSLAS